MPIEWHETSPQHGATITATFARDANTVQVECFNLSTKYKLSEIYGEVFDVAILDVLVKTFEKVAHNHTNNVTFVTHGIPSPNVQSLLSALKKIGVRVVQVKA